MDKNHMPSEVWDEIAYPFPNFNGYNVDFCELIRNFIPQLKIDLITYP